MSAGHTPDAALVVAARAGDAQALDALVGAYLPLLYNIVGRALDAPADVDDVVQDVMLQMVRDLRQLRDPESFRSWLVAIAMRQVRGHWRQRRSAPAATELDHGSIADPGADFVDLTIAALGLSDQRKEVAQATRWLEADDRQILALWWLEAAGQLTRAEMSAALKSTPAQAAVVVHRMKTRLGAARMVVRAIVARPRCVELDAVCRSWDGRPNGLWRKRIARHVRECPTCSALQLDMVPAENLLAGLALVPVPIALHAATMPSSVLALRKGIRLHRAVRPRARVTHWSALPSGAKAVVAVSAVVTLAAGATGITYAANRHPAAAPVATAIVTTPDPTTPIPTPTSASPTHAASSAKPSPTATHAAPQPSSTIVNTAFPIRAAFYYPWYPENLSQSGDSHYTPSAGDYSVDDPSTVDRQIKDMQYAGLQAGIESWWGQGTREDKRLPLLMSEAAKLGFSWSAYYEQEGYGDPSPAQISSDLIYLRKYSDQPTWLHVNGLPVIFVWSSGTDGCGMATRWAEANKTAHYYVVLKVFGGYRNCADQPQGWHQYLDTVDVQAGYSATVSPGFWKYNEASPEVARNPTTFRQNAVTVAESKSPFQLIVSYNEWGEGTAIESSTVWSSSSGHGVYVDILHQVFGEYPR
jgi:RNA polymerase sigma factor (sigma-70 family)